MQTGDLDAMYTPVYKKSQEDIMTEARLYYRRVNPPPTLEGLAIGRQHPFSVETRQSGLAPTVTPLDPS